MNTYLLLRENHETGPHTFEELKALSLRNLDLIWVEGKSEHWDYATEFTELKPLIVPSKPNFGKKVANVAPPTFLQNSKSVMDVPRKALASHTDNEPAAFALRSNTVNANSAVAERSAEIANFQFKPRKSNNSSSWIISLLLMLMFGAFIVKKLVDDRAQQAMVQSAFVALSKAEKRAEDITFQHAISTERYSAPSKKAAKKVNLEEIKNKVRLSNNDYKVKLLGGIKDLQINVTNSSHETLQTVAVELTYANRNGKVIRTENHTIYSVEPNVTKTLVVPPTKRGVKVTYKVSAISLKARKLFVGKA